MRKLSIALALVAGLGIGSYAGVQAALPKPPAKSDAEKAAEAEKAAATKAKDAEMLNKAHDKVVANYKKNKGMADAKATTAKPAAATTSGKK
jgi:hypothetical protein